MIPSKAADIDFFMQNFTIENLDFLQPDHDADGKCQIHCRPISDVAAAAMK